eukprot:CAMPEP_0172051268 /NCGR_PEP_ID=MMETSP1043-20130122/3040_1 /TAXON_ID=464988 /ORGANISM="Hemiselmis andersenii, Strain CCMP441" /LENGTH=90 /DNA_ID=CAMNT_0012710355 /DNA_START=85 /DNA_END=357 /DNA_ORIENTATION=-
MGEVWHSHVAGDTRRLERGVPRIQETDAEARGSKVLGQAPHNVYIVAKVTFGGGAQQRRGCGRSRNEVRLAKEDRGPWAVGTPTTEEVNN